MALTPYLGTDAWHCVQSRAAPVPVPTLVKLQSRLTCPLCRQIEKLTMTTDACRFFHECAACKVLLQPSAGDCCVFCSYGSVVCPPIQRGGGKAACAAMR